MTSVSNKKKLPKRNFTIPHLMKKTGGGKHVDKKKVSKNTHHE